MENGKIQYRRSLVCHRALDLAGGERLVPLDDDSVDVELRPLLDPEHDPQVALGRPLGARGDLHAEEPLVLVFLADRLLGLLDLDRVVEHANPDGGLFPQLLRLELRVPLEAHLAEQGPLDHDEDDAHPTLELLGANLHVIEEPETEDGADVVAERGGREGVADLRLHSIQDGRALDSPVPLDHDVADRRDGARGARLRFLGKASAGEGQEHDQRREKNPSTRRGPPLRAPVDESREHSSGEPGPRGQRSARLSDGSDTGSKVSPSPWTRTSI